jgi:hypothetical protein
MVRATGLRPAPPAAPKDAATDWASYLSGDSEADAGGEEAVA